MKKYTLTNARFEGEVYLTYQAGILIRIDFTQAHLTLMMVLALLRSIPAAEAQLQQSFSAETIIVGEDVAIVFELFWQKYAVKINRPRCEGLWEKLSRADRVLAYFGLDKYHKHLRRNPGKFKMHPDTWLRSRAWENEYK